MLDRLAKATDLPVATVEVTTDADAAALGMNGSPTLLIDGMDPFGAADRGTTGVACRLYRDEEGRIVPAPSVEQLRGALLGTKPSASAQPGPPAQRGS
jgi:hypothetical protein